MNQPKNISEQTQRGPGKQSMGRTYFVFILMLLGGLLIMGRALKVQLVEGGELRANAHKMDYRFFDSESMRGNIYATDGSLLATSVPIFEIRMDAASDLIPDKLFNDSVGYLASHLANMFGDRTHWGYKQWLIKGRKAGNRYLAIQKNVTYDQLAKIRCMPILNRGKYSGGLIAERTTRREYPFGILAKRTIGYTLINGKDSLLVGLEGAFNDYLQGQSGRQLKQRMANSAWKPVYNELNIEPIDGKDIITTINTHLQDVAESALMKQLRLHDAEKGTVVLMEVQTGEIKAIANLNYDEATGDYTEMYNLAVGEAIEPGSTFKLASFMVAMEAGALARIDSVNIGNGNIVFHNRTMRDSHRIKENGWLTPEECLVYSSNAGVSKIIYDSFVGREWDFYKGLQKIFPMEATGINISGEPTPGIKNPDNPHWSKVTLPWMSIGYELTVTPLQMLTFYNAVANNGVMVRPRLVKSVSEAGIITKTFEPEIIKKKICSDKTIATARKYLEGVVENGTGRNVRNAVYKIAGKTGTSKVNEHGRYIAKYNASFVGYFPADNPKYSCIVMIYRPKEGGYYASQVAAPVFKEIADIVYSLDLDIHPADYNAYLENIIEMATDTISDKLLPFLAGANEALLAGHVRREEFSSQIQDEQIPDVSGLSAGDAIFMLENMGLVVKIKGRGLVKRQSLVPGYVFRKGDHIYLNLEI
ncbi:MAG: transpeptidase family protein [Bacteroidales bacterium]|nr:transpeptidase family protein [Bacteroidales bacterium]